MIPISRKERQWFLRNLAQGFLEYMGVQEPPVPVEDLLKNPPPLFESDFGVVDMYSNLWDATFARPPNQRGSIFVGIDLKPEERRFALAREMLSALITSKHGRRLGLFDLLLPHLRESAEYFAGCLLAPDTMLHAYRDNGGNAAELAETFHIPLSVAERRWEEAVASYR
jgi:Zn-dependent peptidase ImmA (M78 family)